jgi:hypothetical protein
MRQLTFNPGFRLSALDVVVLIIGLAGTVIAGSMVHWSGFAIAFVVGHFFLFCNVFRVSRRLELLWAAVFVGLAVSTTLVQFPGWPISIGITLFTTLLVIVLEMRRPSYHGIGWQWINPNLRNWWDAENANGVD